MRTTILKLSKDDDEKDTKNEFFEKTMSELNYSNSNIGSLLGSMVL